jgi:TetR/AcrR family fatty acid metabolism transcriptional regulator
MGSMRMVVLKWKLSGNKSNLVNDGKDVLNGLLKMLAEMKKLPPLHSSELS